MSKPTCKDPKLSGDKEDFEDLEKQLPRQAPVNKTYKNETPMQAPANFAVLEKSINHLVAWYLSAGFMKKNFNFRLIFSSYKARSVDVLYLYRGKNSKR